MQILNYCEQPPTGNIVAIFSVDLPAAGMTFHKLKLIKSKTGKMFISFPSWMEQDDMEKKSFFPYVEMTNERKIEFEKKVMEALEGFLR